MSNRKAVLRLSCLRQSTTSSSPSFLVLSQQHYRRSITGRHSVFQNTPLSSNTQPHHLFSSSTSSSSANSGKLEQKVYPCDICSMEFQTAHYLRLHKVHSHSKNKKKFTGRKIPEQEDEGKIDPKKRLQYAVLLFLGMTGFTTGALVLSTSRPPEMKCDFCDYTSRKPPALEHHLATEHLREIPHKRKSKLTKENLKVIASIGKTKQ